MDTFKLLKIFPALPLHKKKKKKMAPVHVQVDHGHATRILKRKGFLTHLICGKSHHITVAKTEEVSGLYPLT